MSGARAAEKESGEFAARRWLFGHVVLDERSLTLQVADQVVELERKPLEVLLHLLHHAGEVVTKDELLAAVWPGRVLSDSALTSCMHKLREALRDDAQEIIRTQHGYGYRLVAPVKVEASAAPPAPRFDFKEGDRPPLRPQWSLVRRLGAGGHGEAWLARHDKTRETRVFKFAADAAALSSLKREITLSRLLHDALGGRPDLVRVLDWNLEEAPYFVESGYSADGSLVEWAAAQGGLRQLPLPMRVELAAQVADALAAAHSVCVLHKDLKPSNVLVDAVDGPPRIKLADFGSGGVLDAQRLEQLGITRMGFTAAIADAASGTALYLAPEVVAGQPFTLQADIYALGVVLYQLVAGDLGKPLAPGWERDVDEELLREDIAGAAEGNPEQRLADAARLAHRLRNLDERRRVLAAERAARAQAEQARLEVERVKARRVWVRLTIAVSLTGAAVSLLLLLGALRARDEAKEAAATSSAVTAFLSQDMFAQVGSERRPLKDLTLKEVLDSAAGQVEQRFAGRPGAAAEVHAALGTSYQALDDIAAAVAHLTAALDLSEQHGGSGSETSAEVAATLVELTRNLGRLPETMNRYEQIWRDARSRLGESHPKVLNLSRQLALGRYYLGAWEAAATDLRRLIQDARRSAVPNPALVAEAESTLGRVLVQLGDFGEAEASLKRAIAGLSAQFGENNVRVAQARTYLAEALSEMGDYASADREIATGLEAAMAWAPNQAAGYVLRAQIAQGRLRLEQGRLAEATAILEQTLKSLLAETRTEEDQSATVRRPLAEAYQRQGRLREAAEQMKVALELELKSKGAGHPITERVRIGLADILRQGGDAGAAQALLDAVDSRVFRQLPSQHPLLGQQRRVAGLLHAERNEVAAARADLEAALAIVHLRHGPAHWRTQRASAELALVPAPG